MPSSTLAVVHSWRQQVLKRRPRRVTVVFETLVQVAPLTCLDTALMRTGAQRLYTRQRADLAAVDAWRCCVRMRARFLPVAALGTLCAIAAATCE